MRLECFIKDIEATIILGLWVVNATSMRVSRYTQMTFSCAMNFAYYPLDSQVGKTTKLNVLIKM